MSARKIRNSWWVDFRYERVRYRKRSPENSQAGAKSYEITLRQRLTHGEPLTNKDEQKQSVPLFNEFAGKWYDTYVTTNNKQSEQKGKRIILRTHLIPFFGRLRLNEITSLHLEEYKSAKLKATLSPKTINNHLAVLGKCLHTAQEWVGLSNVPKIRLLKVPPQRFDFLTTQESRRLLASITDRGWYAMVLVALRTGLRLGELLGLKWEDINLQTRLLSVRRSILRGVESSPKSNRERHIPFTTEVRDGLLSIGPGRGLVFYRTPGNPMQHETPRKSLIKICEAAGLRKIGWHTLRHTFASQLVAAGASIKAVQELLGHSDIQTTMRYAHLAPSALQDTVALLDKSECSQLENSGQQAVNTAAIIIPREIETAPIWGRSTE